MRAWIERGTPSLRWSSSRLSEMLFRFALIALVTLSIGLTACGAGADCPQGQTSVCRQQNDCRCGGACRTQDDCTGRNACVFYTEANGMPSRMGACVDALWVFDPPPPCIPLCRTRQQCVQWPGQVASCAPTCMSNTDCTSGCCVPLQGTAGSVCASDNTYCRNACAPACADGSLCVQLARPTCAPSCMTNAECAAAGSCCVQLQGGAGGVCLTGTAYCGAPSSSVCPVLGDCMLVTPTFTPVPMAACGAVGSYEAAIRNACPQTTALCLACWWSSATSSYSDCSRTEPIPTNVTVPAGTLHCADAMFPDPPVKVRCIPQPRATSSFDCLGFGPLS